MDSGILVAVQAFAAALPAAWLSLGALDNMFHPSINRDEMARVLAMEFLEDWPEVKAEVGHRAVTDARVVRVLFALAVFAECAASLLLWAGAACLALAFLGEADRDMARDVALVGAAAFSGVWASFLIGGQWFCYWYGAGGQSTHLKALVWGLATVAVVAM